MLRMEYDEAKTMAHIREDSYEEGEQAGAIIKVIELVCKKIKKNKSVSQIADELEENSDTIQKIYDLAKESALDYDLYEIYENLKDEH